MTIRGVMATIGSFVTAHTVQITSDANETCNYIIPGSCSATEVWTATPIGGIGPFTYEWSIVSDPSGVYSIVGSNTSQSCSLRSTASDGQYSCVLRVDIVDTGNGNYMTRTDTSGILHTHTGRVVYAQGTVTIGNSGVFYGFSGLAGGSITYSAGSDQDIVAFDQNETGGSQACRVNFNTNLTGNPSSIKVVVDGVTKTLGGGPQNFFLNGVNQFSFVGKVGLTLNYEITPP
jgi:hypothetical protein